MGILYILTLIILGISFMAFKKSDKKLNFIKWLMIYVVSLLAYNIVLGMVLGLCNITAHILLLCGINLAFSIVLGYRCIKFREIQAYFVRKIDIVGICIILVIFTVMFIKDIYIYQGDVTHYAVDSAVHYRAAKHYADHLKLFIHVEDKTFFNFNVMQTGAYINDGIFMNVIHNITHMHHVYIYQIFETMVMFLGGLAFYSAFMDKIQTKRGLVASLILFALYIYGYPYNSWIYGFSYLSVGIAMVAMLLTVVEYLYTEEKVHSVLIFCLIGMLATGLTFSYCLFVPAIFAAICIYVFLKDFSQEGKTYGKFFKKNTCIITIMLLIIAFVGIGYLVVPTFFIEGQTNLIDALKVEGGIYNEKYRNFLPYIPFALIYAVEVIKRIQKKQLRYMDVFSVVLMGYLALICLGRLYGFVSRYYMLKMYFIIWMVVFIVAIDIVNQYVNDKMFRIDFILLLLLYPILILKGKDIFSIVKIYLYIILVLYITLGEVIKRINVKAIFSKLKLDKWYEKLSSKFMPILRVTGTVYVVIWGLFVSSWVLIKAGGVIGEEQKHALPNLVGMYYSENCDQRKLIDLEQNLNANEIQLVTYARDHISDLSADNLELITNGYYTRIWATAMSEITSDTIPYEIFVQDSTIYTVQDALLDTSKKYIMQLVSKDQEKLKLYQKQMELVRENENIEILLENENGFIAKVNHHV